MLTLKVEGSLGYSMEEMFVVDMPRLAKITNCRIEAEENGVRLAVWPSDTREELKKAWDRLYPKSWLIRTDLRKPLIPPK